MKNNTVISLCLFAFSQCLLWLASENTYLATGGEVMCVTLLIGLFIGLFFANYRWARWVATILLGLIALSITSLVVYGLSLGFLAIPVLYAAVILTLFSHRVETKQEQSADTETVTTEFNELPTLLKPTVEYGFYVGEDLFRYPLLLKRYQSLFIDIITLFSVMVVTMVIMGQSEARPTVMITMGGVFLLVYEPLLTVYSATLGQYIIGIRVRSIKNPNQRINILQAYMRLIVKWYLGWLSFVTINFNPRHRAIHDFAGSSVVIKIR